MGSTPLSAPSITLKLNVETSFTPKEYVADELNFCVFNVVVVYQFHEVIFIVSSLSIVLK